MCCPPNMIILKYMRRKGPLEKHNEIEMGGIKQAEIIVQKCIYPLTSAGNSVTKYENCSSQRKKNARIS